MNLIKTRALILVAGAVLIAAAAIATATRSLGAPKSEPDFTIKAHIDGSGDRWFRSWGDIEDEGIVYAYWYIAENGQDVYELYFLSDLGSITVLVPIDDVSSLPRTRLSGDFVVLEATGVYEGLEATGTAICRTGWYKVKEYGEWEVRYQDDWVLKGSITAW